MTHSFLLLFLNIFALEIANSNQSIIGNTKPYPNSTESTGYNLSKPDAVLTLPDTLREVSGLTDIDHNTIACIQDENGIIFIYDIIKNEIIKQFSFGIDGDYEGITRVGDTIYILRSDGTLFEISNYKKANFKLSSYLTGIPADNNEGLCYDPANNILLIASKGKIGKGPEFKNKRVIYGFDLKSKKLLEKPVFDFDVEKIKTYAIEHNIELPTKTREKNGKKVTEPFIKFMTSAVGIHPVSNKLYLLSASDHLFFVFNRNSEIEYIEYLNPKTFNQAEGITFLENNDMIITNEGQNGKPTLLRFNYKK